MEVVLYPDPRLTAKNTDLTVYTPAIAARMAEMVKKNVLLGGAGLAAPQVGWNVRLFILAVRAVGDKELTYRIVWNPAVEPSGNLVPMREGCLSFPDVFGTIRRWTKVRLMGQTPEGPIDRMFESFGAQAVQHEMDHLDGVLFTERMSEADRRLNRPLLKALEERARRRGSE